MRQEASPRNPADAIQSGIAAGDALGKLSGAAHAAFDVMPLGCVIVTPDFTVADWNPAAERILGFAKADVIGRLPFGLFVDESMRERFIGFLGGLESDLNPRSWMQLSRTKGRREVLCEWRNTALRGADGRFIGALAIFQDVSERENVRRLLLDSEEKFRGLVEQSMSGIYVLDGERIGFANRRCAEIFGYTEEEVVGRNFIESIAEKDRALVAGQLAKRITGKQVQNSYVVRAVRKDGTEIIIAITTSRVTIDGKPTVMGSLQDITAHEGARQRIEESMLGTVRAICALIEARDPYTASHELRVAKLARAIGVELGFDPEHCRGLYIIGTVHDVGKIGVPAEILAKPTHLSDVEFALVKGHPRTGYEVLKDIDFPWPVAECVLQHHERLDGSGYPQGLKGNDIIMEARVIAVADVVEAIATHRPYRAGLGLQMGLDEISRFRGIRYDADVVDACVRLFRDRHYSLDAQ